MGTNTQCNYGDYLWGLLAELMGTWYLHNYLWGLLAKLMGTWYLHDYLWGLLAELMGTWYLHNYLWGLLAKLMGTWYLHNYLWGLLAKLMGTWYLHNYLWILLATLIRGRANKQLLLLMGLFAIAELLIFLIEGHMFAWKPTYIVSLCLFERPIRLKMIPRLWYYTIVWFFTLFQPHPIS